MNFLNFLKSKPSHLKKGILAEKVAKDYLIKKGFTFIDQNFNCRVGELDLIMQDGQTLVFVEVRYRKSAQFGGALLSVTPQKCKKILKSASFYMQKHGFNEYNTAYRIDIVAIEGDLSNPEINWLSNAIE